MRRRRFNGRLIGLLAAYLVALQAVVLPLAMPPAVAFADQLCLTDASGGPQPHRDDHDRACPCCVGGSMQCQHPALDAGMPAVVPAGQAHVIAILAPARIEAGPFLRPRMVQQPRAPPAG